MVPTEHFDKLASRFEELLDRAERLPSAGVTFEDHADLKSLKTQLEETRKLLEETRKALFDSNPGAFFSRLRAVEDKLSTLSEKCARCNVGDELKLLQKELKALTDLNSESVRDLGTTVDQLKELHESEKAAKKISDDGRRNVVQGVVIGLAILFLGWFAVQFGAAVCKVIWQAVINHSA